MLCKYLGKNGVTAGLCLIKQTSVRDAHEVFLLLPKLSSILVE